MAALPLIKVAALLIKSASKPISKQIKNQTTKSPAFQAFVVRFARIWHSAEGRFQVWAGEAGKTKRKELNIAAAVDLGAELASEGFLLFVAIALLAVEATRSNAKDKAKSEALNARLTSIEENLTKMNQIQQAQDAKITQLQNELSTRKVP